MASAVARARHERRRDASIGYGAAAASPPVGGAAPIVDETNALGVDFSYPVDALRVAVKTAGTVAYSRPDSFFQNAGTGPKLVWGDAGLLIWSPHNMFLNSAVPATQSVTTIVGATYTVTVTGSGSLVGSAGASGTATAASPLTYVATTTSSTFTLGGSLTRMQMNRGTVATDYLATTGTARYGLAIDNDPILGRALLAEAVLNNICLWGSDLTQAAWVKSTMTTAFTATGPLGVANNATTLTATGANATALQAITSASSARITSVFLKRRTGTGNVDLTQDNATTWATQTITSSWARYAIAEVTSTNPTVGIRLVTSGDEVDVALFQHESSAVMHVATSPVPTFGALVQRAADALTFPLSAIPTLAAEYSLYVRFVIPNTAVQSGVAPYTLGDGTASEQSRIGISAGTLRLTVTKAGTATGTMIGTTPSPNVPVSAAGRVKVDNCAFSMNGAAVVTDNTVPTLPTVATVYFSNLGTAAAAANVCRIAAMVIVTDRGWSNAELVVKSAT